MSEEETPTTEGTIIPLGTIIMERYLDEEGIVCYSVMTDNGADDELELPEALMILEMGKLQLVAQPLEYFAAVQGCNCGDHDGEDE